MARSPHRPNPRTPQTKEPRMRLPPQVLDFLQDLFTSKDGVSFDIARVLWVVAILWFLGLATWDLVQNKTPFDALAYAGGMAALLFGGAAGVAVKGNQEPDA